MKKITAIFIILFYQCAAIAQTGLPIWPLSPTAGEPFQAVDWRDNPPTTTTVSPTDFALGSVGTAFNGCGDLIFYALHTGENLQDNLFIFTPEAAPLLSTTTANGPGLNGVKGFQEIQVIPVPQTPDQWFIFYGEWSDDAGAPNGNSIYRPAKILYSRVQSDGTYLDVLERDVALIADGTAQTYNDGRAVTANASGNLEAHFLYATRRSINNPNLSVDRFLINESGISFAGNTGDIDVGYWELTHSNSPVEVSQDGQKIAVINRNEADNQPDLIIFNALGFSTATAEIIYIQDLFLPSDGEAIDQTDTLFVGGIIEDIAANTATEFQWLQNIQHKVSNLEWSPNRDFLYLTGGGFSNSDFSHLTYLMQIDMNSNPREVRLQVQETPGGGYNILTGQGCASSNAGCNNLWRSIGGIQTSFDENIYFVKRNDSTLYVLPNPNEVMPQNLVPGFVDLSTSAVPNITTQGGIQLLPDQIDGFDYLQMNFTLIDTLTTDTFACPGSSIVFDGNEIFAGDTLYIAGVLNACDTVLEIIVNPFLDNSTQEEITICGGETADIFGEEIGIAGAYSMSFNSDIGCDSMHTINLNVLPEIEVTFDIIPTCLDEDSGEITATISGGTPPFNLLWSNGENTNTISELSVNTYTLSVTDNNDCVVETTADIGLTGESGFSLTTTAVTCHGDTDGSIFIQTQNTDLTFSLDGISYTETPLFNNLPAGDYAVFVQDAANCVYQENTVITEPTELVIVLPPDTLLALGDSLLITPFLSREDSLIFAWSPDNFLNCTDCPEVISTPFETVFYNLTVQDTFGCATSDDLEIRVNNQYEIFLPNAFSPNFDGINDVIYPYGNASILQINAFRIYDRWGNLLFENNNFSPSDSDAGWDGFFRGKKMQPGVYVYVLEVTFIDGEVVVFKGDLSLF